MPCHASVQPINLPIDYPLPHQRARGQRNRLASWGLHPSVRPNRDERCKGAL
ncbi:hypothetical protein BVG79_00802 [Ketogulonicigenium robustum]|uniref:Uncharacterized protein n=1 Tax=Ketogulonicigenium robustum TaxID=92947 RepID=A0A1W6NY57_9RHOB|nr:hypothetical protein BVG79_00802 [Ketogulonicigenium robustum]